MTESHETLQVLQVRHESKNTHSCDSFFAIHKHVYLQRNTNMSFFKYCFRSVKTFLTYLINSINAFDYSFAIHFAAYFCFFHSENAVILVSLVILMEIILAN